MKIAFLLGSGASIYAGMPSAGDIEQLILSGENIWRTENSNYYLEKRQFTTFLKGISANVYVSRVVGFLKLLKEKYSYKVSLNYEDLYYIARQIYDSESGELDNPIVKPFITLLTPQISEILRKKDMDNGDWRLLELASESCNYIHDIVSLSLGIKNYNNLGSQCLIQACKEEKNESIDIFTLNHDKVIETSLKNNAIAFIDGFGSPINDVRYWQLDLYQDEEKIKLYKLHGSIDWFRWRPYDGHWREERIGIPLKFHELSDNTTAPNGKTQLPIDGRPKMLIGTFNKFQDYLSGIFLDLFYQFRHRLSTVNKLVISGYGFGDRGINMQIVNWIYSSSDNNKIILIHPEPEKLRSSSRAEFTDRWNDWLSKNQLIIIPKKLEEVTWEEIREAVFLKSDSRS